jgi:hypothetical protein
LKQWGSYDYDKIKAKNVATITVPSASAEMTEKMSIVASATAVTVAWDKTKVVIPVK